MRTILKGALVALTLAAMPLIGPGNAQAADVGMSVGNEGVSVYYDTYHRWHLYRHYAHGHHRPYLRAGYQHDSCWYHPYNWQCRHYHSRW